MNKHRGSTTLAAVACLAVAGCGGDDDDGDSAPKTDWVKQANAICRETQQKVESLPKKLG